MFLPDMTGRDVLNHLKKLSIEVPFVVMTGKGNENLAVEMMKLGAADYLIKDTKYYEVLPRVVEKVFENALFEKKLKKADFKNPRHRASILLHFQGNAGPCFGC